MTENNAINQNILSASQYFGIDPQALQTFKERVNVAYNKNIAQKLRDNTNIDPFKDDINKDFSIAEYFSNQLKKGLTEDQIIENLLSVNNDSNSVGYDTYDTKEPTNSSSNNTYTIDEFKALFANNKNNKSSFQNIDKYESSDANSLSDVKGEKVYTIDEFKTLFSKPDQKQDDKKITTSLDSQIMEQKKEDSSFFKSVSDFFDPLTGIERSTKESKSLPSFRDMPELSGFDNISIGRIKSALVRTIGADQGEMARTVRSNFPDVSIRYDSRGNPILKSAVDGKEYIVKPGLELEDIREAAPALVGGGIAGASKAAIALPRALQRLVKPASALYAPASSIGGAVAKGAATGTAAQFAQLGLGGELNAEDIVSGSIGSGLLKGLGNIGSRALGSVPNQKAKPSESANKLLIDTAEDISRAAMNNPDGDLFKQQLSKATPRKDVVAASEALGMKNLPPEFFLDDDAFGSNVKKAINAYRYNSTTGKLSELDSLIKEYNENILALSDSKAIKNDVLAERVRGSILNTSKMLKDEYTKLYKTSEKATESVPVNLNRSIGQFERKFKKPSILGPDGEVLEYSGLSPEGKKIINDISTKIDPASGKKGSPTLNKLIATKKQLNEMIGSNYTAVGVGKDIGELKAISGFLDDQITKTFKTNPNLAKASKDYNLAKSLAEKRFKLIDDTSDQLGSSFAEASKFIPNIDTKINSVISDLGKGQKTNLLNTLKVLPKDQSQDFMRNLVNQALINKKNSFGEGYYSWVQNVKKSGALDQFKKTMSNEEYDFYFKHLPNINKAIRSARSEGKPTGIQDEFNKIFNKDVGRISNFTAGVARVFSGSKGGNVLTSTAGFKDIVSSIFAKSSSRSIPDTKKLAAFNEFISGPEFKRLILQNDNKKMSPEMLSKTSGFNKLFGAISKGLKPSEFKTAKANFAKNLVEIYGKQGIIAFNRAQESEDVEQNENSKE